MSNSSQVVAKRIMHAVLDALQDADELGGPDRPEYIELMDMLAAECRKRAQTAEETDPTAEVLAWVKEHINANASIWPTGGNCTAIAVPVEGGGHWLITDDASAPDSLTGPLALGIYDESGERWVCFDVADMAAAAHIIGSYVSSSL